MVLALAAPPPAEAGRETDRWEGVAQLWPRLCSLSRDDNRRGCERLPSPAGAGPNRGVTAVRWTDRVDLTAARRPDPRLRRRSEPNARISCNRFRSTSQPPPLGVGSRAVGFITFQQWRGFTRHPHGCRFLGTPRRQAPQPAAMCIAIDAEYSGSWRYWTRRRGRPGGHDRDFRCYQAVGRLRCSGFLGRLVDAPGLSASWLRWGSCRAWHRRPGGRCRRRRTRSRRRAVWGASRVSQAPAWRLGRRSTSAVTRSRWRRGGMGRLGVMKSYRSRPLPSRLVSKPSRAVRRVRARLSAST